jgi:hypothetical protein
MQGSWLEGNSRGVSGGEGSPRKRILLQLVETADFSNKLIFIHYPGKNTGFLNTICQESTKNILQLCPFKHADACVPPTHRNQRVRSEFRADSVLPEKGTGSAGVVVNIIQKLSDLCPFNMDDRIPFSHRWRIEYHTWSGRRKRWPGRPGLKRKDQTDDKKNGSAHRRRRIVDHAGV